MKSGKWKVVLKQLGIKVSKLGDMNENETPNAPFGERNMDLWNNAIGRKVTEKIKWQLGSKSHVLSRPYYNLNPTLIVVQLLGNNMCQTNMNTIMKV